MPAVAFKELPDLARVWIFASDRPLHDTESAALLAEVDAFLAQWKAHGAPLRSARDWRDARFLVIGVDPTAEQASGCSIDVLFRGLQSLERSLGTSLVGGGRVFYKDAAGAPRMAPRKDVPGLFATGAMSGDTIVFDTSITNAADFRDRFEQPAKESWVGKLVATAAGR
ncbi:MAG: hypothetical protein WD801_16360 [Gemmatimonadaceae bacterium]